jgi:hypothetical protein
MRLIAVLLVVSSWAAFHFEDHTHTVLDAGNQQHPKQTTTTPPTFHQGYRGEHPMPPRTLPLLEDGDLGWFLHDPPGMDSTSSEGSSNSIWNHEISLKVNKSRTAFMRQRPQLIHIKVRF